MNTPNTHHDRTSTPQRIAVLGANGASGAAIVAAALDAGHHVVAVTRTGTGAPEGAESRDADLTDRDAVGRAVADVDVVVFAANIPYPRWAAELDDLVDVALDATAAAGARFVMIDNLYMYAPADGPIGERSPECATDVKGSLRRRIGERLLDRHRAGDLSVVIARASDFFGPGATSSGLYQTGIKSGLAGKKMRGLFALDQPHAFAFLPDLGRQVVALTEAPDADGRVWILPPTVTATQREMFEIVNAHLDRAVPVGVVGPLLVRIGGWFSPMLRELRSVRPQFDRPWLLDAGAFEERFDVVTTDVDDAVAATVSSFR